MVSFYKNQNYEQFQPKTNNCVFIGYGSQHKDTALHPPIGRVFCHAMLSLMSLVFHLYLQINKRIVRLQQIQCCQPSLLQSPTGMDSQSLYILYHVSYNNDDIANLINNSVLTTSIFPTDTHVSDDSVDLDIYWFSCFMCDLDCISFSPYTILTTANSSQEQIGVSPTNSNDESAL